MYKEIIVTTTSENADLVADGFFAIGVSGVKIIDPRDVQDVIKSGMHWDYIDDGLLNPTNKDAKVSAFVSQEECSAKIEELKAYLKEVYGLDAEELKIVDSDYEDGDWLNEWKKFYKPIPVGKFVVVPEWEHYDNPEGLTPILIDPSMAFGTGEHESTRLCLSLLSDIDLDGKDVIDVGTGSGILGIGAAKKGAASVYMCDIDSLSVKSAAENAERNGVRHLVTIENADLLQKTDRKGDVVLANLTADILIRLSEGLSVACRKGTVLICSGIIHSRKQEVIDAFVKQGFRLTAAPSMGEWDALQMEYYGA